MLPKASSFIARWVKFNGIWMARGPVRAFSGTHVIVVARNGRQTLCKIAGPVPTPVVAEQQLTVKVELESPFNAIR